MLIPMAAEDVIVGIFCHLKNHSEITADRETLHKAFYQIKSKHPKVMSVFTFRQREQFPESSQLDQALSNLDVAGIISRQNVAPRYYRFEDPLIRSYDRFSKSLLEKAGILDREMEAVASDLEPLVYGKS